LRSLVLSLSLLLSLSLVPRYCLGVLQVFRGVLQGVTCVLQYMTGVMLCVAVCCGVFQCVAVQFVAVCCRAV
jgi:hypothetical protein